MKVKNFPVFFFLFFWVYYPLHYRSYDTDSQPAEIDIYHRDSFVKTKKCNTFADAFKAHGLNF